MSNSVNHRNCSTAGVPVLHYLQEVAQTRVHWVSGAIPLILGIPFSFCIIFPRIRVFSNESAHCIRWQKYYSFSFSICPPNECSGLIFFRIDWFDPFAVQGNLKNLLQHHNLKASILQRSDLFMVQLWHLYMTTGKTIGLTIQTFVSKVMSLLFNMLTGFIIVFLPRSKHLLISWL